MKIDITSLDGSSAGSIELDDEIFGLEPRTDLIARMVRYQLAKRRAELRVGLEHGRIAFEEELLRRHRALRQKLLPYLFGASPLVVLTAPMMPGAEYLGPDVLLINGSGGTDVCSGIVGASPLLPVYDGEISGRLLGVATDAFDPQGRSLVGELGELVITKPMPSMPVELWGDTDGSLYRSSYFEMYPGIWRQGDWIRFSERGSCEVTGRSDATLNRGGVRLGTGEFYSVIEELPQIVDSLVVHLEDDQGSAGELLLFVVLADGVVFDDELRGSIERALRSQLSPRHVPDMIRAVPAIPRTLTGKKLEAPVKRILRGAAADEVASRDSLLDPTALDHFVALARAMTVPEEAGG